MSYENCRARLDYDFFESCEADNFLDFVVDKDCSTSFVDWTALKVGCSNACDTSVNQVNSTSITFVLEFFEIGYNRVNWEVDK